MCNSNLDRNCRFCPNLDLCKACHTGKNLPTHQQGFIWVIYLSPFVFGIKDIKPCSLLNLAPRDLQEKSQVLFF